MLVCGGLEWNVICVICVNIAKFSYKKRDPMHVICVILLNLSFQKNKEPKSWFPKKEDPW